jgi:hypothetical protein
MSQCLAETLALLRRIKRQSGVPQYKKHVLQFVDVEQIEATLAILASLFERMMQSPSQLLHTKVLL